MSDTISEKKGTANRKRQNYISAENYDLEDLIHRIRAGGAAKDEFRKIFEINALLFIEKKFKAMIQKTDMYEKVPIRFWCANTQEMAEIMVEIVLKNIERGKFNKYDDQGKTKIKNIGGAIWGKMKYIFYDLVNGIIEPMKNEFNEEIPFERKMIEFLDHAMKAEDDVFIIERLSAMKRKQKKKLKSIETASQFFRWLKESAEEHSTSPLDMLINQQNVETIKEIIIRCFKSLSSTEKKYSAFIALGFLRKDVAELFGVEGAAITQAMNKGMTKLYECLEKNEIKTTSELFGD